MSSTVRQLDDRVITLEGGYYAIRFPYSILTEHTLWMAITEWLRLEIIKERQQVVFHPETEVSAGKHRANAQEYEAAIPGEIARLRHQVKDLADYIIIKLIY